MLGEDQMPAAVEAEHAEHFLSENGLSENGYGLLTYLLKCSGVARGLPRKIKGYKNKKQNVTNKERKGDMSLLFSKIKAYGWRNRGRWQAEWIHDITGNQIQ